MASDGILRTSPIWFKVLAVAARHGEQSVEERMRTHLGKRHKVRSRGERFARFASWKFYTEQGLYKVPPNATWKMAHALV